MATAPATPAKESEHTVTGSSGRVRDPFASPLPGAPEEAASLSAAAVPQYNAGEDLADVMNFVAAIAQPAPAGEDARIRLPLPRVRCIELLKVLKRVHTEPLHPFAILHVKSRPLIPVLDGCSKVDFDDMQTLVSKLRLPATLGARIQQAEASAACRSMDPWFDGSSDGGSGSSGASADGPGSGSGGVMAEIADMASSFSRTFFGWLGSGRSGSSSSGSAGSKSSSGSAAAGSGVDGEAGSRSRGGSESGGEAAARREREVAAAVAALTAATRGVARLRPFLARHPVLKPLWDGALAALPLLEAAGAAGAAPSAAAALPFYATQSFLDGLCADPYSKPTAAAAASPAAGAGGAAVAVAIGEAPAAAAASAAPAVAASPLASLAQYLAGRVAGGHALPSGITYPLSLHAVPLPLEAAAAVGNAYALRSLLGGGWRFDLRVSAAAARAGHVHVLAFIEAYLKEAATPGSAAAVDAAATAPVDAGVAADVAAEGVKAAAGHQVPWDETTCAAAAAGNQAEVLVFLREKGCRWDHRTIAAAAAADAREALEWARSQGCPE